MILIRLVSSAIILLYEFSIYFLSLIGPAAWIYDHRDSSAAALVGRFLIGYLWSGFSFLLLLIVTRFLFFRSTPAGPVPANSKEAGLWFYSVSLISILERSPFRRLLEIGVLAPLFLRAMGGRIPLSAAFGLRALVFEPWLVEMGENVSVGAEAIIAGHFAVGSQLFLGKVVIGDNVTVGGRTLILPDVRIGNNATVAAGAIVTRGTVIPEGETWGGVPAKPLRKTTAS